MQAGRAQRSVKPGVRKPVLLRDPISAEIKSQSEPQDDTQARAKQAPFVVAKCEHGRKPKKCKDCAK